MRSSTPDILEPSRATSELHECIAELGRRSAQLVPQSTYRLQFHRAFRFADAQALVAYLQQLGVSHIYSSPILEARAGSTHGYDIVNHERLNPEVGSEDDFRNFVAALKQQGLGLVLDVVPNHMGVGTHTPWWRDVLQHGRASLYADYFDIDWKPLKPELHNKILLPVLGGQYGEELEAGKLQLRLSDGEVVLSYYDHDFPLDPATLALIFDAPMQRLQGSTSELKQFAALLEEVRVLPPTTSTDPAVADERRKKWAQIHERWRNLLDASERLRRFVEDALKKMNGHAGDSRSFDLLHLLLELQVYRLAHWRVSGEEINYRRFFDINDLVGLRMENPRVFADSHGLLRRLLADGSVSGIRIDHPDGMLNPRQYFIRAQMLYVASQCSGAVPQPPLAENGIEEAVQTAFGEVQIEQQRNGSTYAPMWMVVEKILEPGEELPREWPVAGTSGYDYANLVNGLFVQRASEHAFTRAYERFVGDVPQIEQLIYEAKKLILHSALASEVNVLTHLLGEISTADRRARDFTQKTLRDAIREAIACFPVYRSYIDERGEYTARDEQYILEAIRRAKRLNTGLAEPVFDFLRDILLLRSSRTRQDESVYRQQLYFALKFQQLTGPVMAKGLEDTVFYRYNRFISLNEVGGSPEHFGLPLDDFHAANLHRAAEWPHSMLATSTHDTKRSEDVRARLNVLSEMPKQWTMHALRARRMSARHKVTISDGRVVPDANEEYLLYQTIAGAWPLEFDAAKHEEFVMRIQQYMSKAVHEAKTNLSWVNQNPEYVDALNKFIAAALSLEGRNSRLVQQMQAFIPPVAYFGAINSLAQTLLKLTSPGVPDIYQGQELFDFSLVDPDNRRPVDFAARQQLLEKLATSTAGAEFCQEMLASYTDGRLKLWTTSRALQARREHPELFRDGSYEPLFSSGDKREHVCAFRRSLNGTSAVIAVPRFAYTLMKGKLAPPLADAWGDALLSVPEGSARVYTNLFTGEQITANESRSLLCSELFAHFPVALLLSR